MAEDLMTLDDEKLDLLVRRDILLFKIATCRREITRMEKRLDEIELLRESELKRRA